MKQNVRSHIIDNKSHNSLKIHNGPQAAILLGYVFFILETLNDNNKITDMKIKMASL